MRVARLLPTLALSSFLSVCVCDGVSPLPASHLDLDTILGPGEVRCGPVVRDSELIGGPQAFGQVNRGFRCHNARIRFFVQDASRPVGNSVEGGNLIDIDRVRVDELVAGNDTFREHVSGLGAMETRVETIEVTNDGTDGRPGVIRVTGTPVALSLAPQAAFLSQALEGRLVTEYRLAPDSDVIEIETTFTNFGDTIFGGLGIDFLAIGAATPIVTPETGFGDIAPFAQADFLVGARGDGVNVGFVCDGKRMTNPVISGGVTVPLCEDDLTIGAEGTFKRFLIVGDGSIDSVARQAWAMLGRPLGEVRGVVADAVPGAVVSALSGPINDADAHVVSEANVAADGTYALALPPGDYTVVAHVPDRQGQRVSRSAPAAVSVIEDAVASADLSLGAAGRLVVVTNFGDGATHAAKLTLLARDDGGRSRSALGELGGDGSLVRYELSRDGAFTVELPPGTYRAYVTRGFEWSRFEADVDVSAGVVVELRASIEHVLDTTGFVGGEFHQHSLGSIDAEVPVPLKVLENAAEGIEVAVSTDHDTVTDFRPHVEALGLSGQLVAFAGNEVSYQAIGHFNAYPWSIDDADPFKGTGSALWWSKTLPELFREIRAVANDDSGEDILIQLNHPRTALTGVLASMAFDPTDGSRRPRNPPNIETLPITIYDEWSPAFDAIEVNTNFGDVALFADDGEALQNLVESSGTSVPVLADWFGLLHAGLPVAATANSDSHGINAGVGYPRTLVFVGSDDPSAVTDSVLRDAMRRQRTAVAEGCLLTLLVDDAPRMGARELVSRNEAITLRLQAPPHATVGRLELYVGGRAKPLRAVDGTIAVDEVSGVVSLPLAELVGSGVERLRHELTDLDVGTDTTIVAISRGGAGLPPTGGGEVACMSPPLYVDGDGDGAFTPPFFATEQVTRQTP
jgi:hypothetical protein